MDFQKGELMKVKCQRAFKYVYLVGKYFQLCSHWPFSEKRIKRIQNRELRKLMEKAYQIPFYRRRFEEVGLTPADFTKAEDLYKFPVMEKKDLIDEMKMQSEMQPDLVRSGVKISTSGSTGIPLVKYITPFEDMIHKAVWLRELKIQGYNPLRGKTMILNGHYKEEAAGGKFTKALNKFGFLRNYKMNFLLTGEELIRNYNDFCPDYFTGNVTPIMNMVSASKKHNSPVHTPKLIRLNGEQIMKQNVEEILEVFGGTVYAQYASEEGFTGGITVRSKENPFDESAWNLYHIMEDTNIINFVDSAGLPATSGSMLITVLFVKSFPVINYKIGDFADKVTIEGIGHLKNIIGRNNDRFVLSDGFVLDWRPLYFIIKNNPELVQVRFVQESNEVIRLFAVSSIKLNFGSDLEQKLLKELNALVSCHNTSFNIEWVDVIKSDKTGKVRMMVSEI
jgi:phenylacetate-coenzyme A ligase PaaK-like adenylate-forming protein